VLIYVTKGSMIMVYEYKDTRN